MKTLYFDVDGTVVLPDQDRAKSCLAAGHLERAVRDAGFERLVCVGNFCRIAHYMRENQIEYDELGVLLELCRGVFSDHQWFRSVTTLVADPENRVCHIDLSGDWWYVDDLAAEYFQSCDRAPILSLHRGGRVCIPDPTGDGEDVLEWLVTTSSISSSS